MVAEMGAVVVEMVGRVAGWGLYFGAGIHTVWCHWEWKVRTKCQNDPQVSDLSNSVDGGGDVSRGDSIGVEFGTWRGGCAPESLSQGYRGQQSIWGWCPGDRGQRNDGQD